jgi:cysteine desulfurase / selenocysteine lyase
VQATGADFAIADGHKWMLAPEGLGLFYVRKDVLERLSLCQYGWHMTEKLSDYSQQDFAIEKTARRFECGSPNMMGIHALNSSLQLLLDSGMQKIGDRVLQRTQYLIDGLKAIDDIELFTDTTEQRLSGIVTFGHRNIQDTELYKMLTYHSVLCVPRWGGIRLSPHFYTPFDQLDKVLDLIRDFKA